MAAFFLDRDNLYRAILSDASEKFGVKLPE